MPSHWTRRHFLGSAAGVVSAAFTPVLIGGQEPAASAAPRRSRRIIDSHVHLKHGDAARTEYSPETIIATMDQAGIDQSVVFAMSTTTRRSIEMAELAVRKYPDRLIPYVYALPHYDRPVIKEIQEALSTKGFRGVKIHAGECTLAEYVVDPVLDAAGQCRAPCLVDCAGNYKAARRMAEAFPATKLIVAHMGRYLCKDGQLLDQFIGLAQDLGNVYLDLSGVVLTEKIKQAAAKVGARRLVWGTDGPDRQPDTATFARNELDKIRRLKASDEDKAAILGGTISSLLRLE